MSDYAIGDIQGCFDQLLQLLELIKYNEHSDRLWFVGDLVNRGPKSLEVLRFIFNLPHQPRVTLGNHDLHFLNRLFNKIPPRDSDDSLKQLIMAPDAEILGHWLRKQPLLVHDPYLNFVMLHAGIAPAWDLTLAKACAAEVELVLRGSNFCEFLQHMYGNLPLCWSNNLTGYDRLRIITNYFTRMRFCNQNGCLYFYHKGAAKNFEIKVPWFEVSDRKPIDANIVFGHWAALEGKTNKPNIIAIDTGCVWGGKLTALRLQDQIRFTVQGLKELHS